MSDNSHLSFEFPSTVSDEWECLAYLLVTLGINGDRVYLVEPGDEYTPSVRIALRKVDSGWLLVGSVGLVLDGYMLATSPIYDSVMQPN